MRRTTAGHPLKSCSGLRVPRVITMEPQPGDEEVFSDAWPLVDEWRGVGTAV